MAPKRRSKKLSTRLFAAFLALTLSVLALSAAAVLATSWNEYEGEAERNLAEQADSISSLLSHEGTSDPTEALNMLGSPDLRITIISEDGTVTFDNQADASSMPNHAGREEIVAAQAEDKSVVLRRSETTGYDTLYAAVPIEGTTDVLRIAETRTSLYHYLARLALPLVAIFVVALVLSLLLSRFMASRITAPLVDIDVESPLSSETYEEISPLLEKIELQNNELMEKNAELQTTIDMRREFTGNVSHEMKSPLQVISGYAELIEGGIAKDDEAQRFAGLIVNESAKMRSLIDDVLVLSRLDEQRIGKLMKVDLAEACRNVIQRLAASAQERQISIVCLLPTYAPVMGTPPMIEQLVYNLLDNAIRYGNEGGNVELSVTCTGDQTLLAIDDDGPGIPKELRERVFERFYRVDASRSRDAGGTGLGMAIVKHTASSMGAKTWVCDSELGGLRACVSFPPIP